MAALLTFKCGKAGEIRGALFFWCLNDLHLQYPGCGLSQIASALPHLLKEEAAGREFRAFGPGKSAGRRGLEGWGPASRWLLSEARTPGGGGRTQGLGKQQQVCFVALLGNKNLALSSEMTLGPRESNF